VFFQLMVFTLLFRDCPGTSGLRAFKLVISAFEMSYSLRKSLCFFFLTPLPDVGCDSRFFSAKE